MSLIKEPLVHFLLLGALLFVWFDIVNDQVDPEGKEIVVTQAKVDQLIEVFTRTWKRTPGAAELKALVDEYIREEIMYREGVAIGLDKNDTIVRRRIKQKFEFLAEDAAAADPGDEELNAFLKASGERYEDAPHYSFKQIFISAENGKESAARLLETVKSAPDSQDWLDAGDPSLLEREYENISGFEIDRIFGHKFSTEFIDLRSNEWQGPIESGYGFHLVFIESKVDGRKPELSEVRDAVLRDYRSQQRKKYLDQMYAGLRKNYTISIESSDKNSESILVQEASAEE